MELGLLEMLIMFGIVLALAVRELVSVWRPRKPPRDDDSPADSGRSDAGPDPD